MRSPCTVLMLVVALAATGCRTWHDRVRLITQSAQLESEVLRGTEFDHQAFHSALGPATPGGIRTLVVMLEGDGTPWVDRGTRIAGDPTPRRPLALELAARTPGAVLYLGRPCYFGRAHEAGCSPELWTSARYSDRVIQSMAAALNRFVAAHAVQDVVLVGYSGGGTLAVLMAPHIPSVRTVVTIAANLDISAWTTRHGYLPLTDSRNPAEEPPLPATIAEWHIAGARDHNVPMDLNSRYWTRIDRNHLWTYAQADHACCWVELWPEIIARLQVALDSAR